MKTVLQELIDWLEDSTINQNQDKDNCIVKAKELLEEEKENSIDAYNAGWKAYRDKLNQNAEDYFNETFKQE